MDLQKIKIETLKSYDIVKLQSLSDDIRKELLALRMDIFSEKAKNSGSFRKLRKTLARTLTLINAKKNEK
jgi:ribosomal protein L29